MINVEQDVLCVLLQRLVDKDLITQDIHDQASSKIRATLQWPSFFTCAEEEEKEGSDGHTQDPC